MSNQPDSTNENSSLNSLLLKRDAALLPGGGVSSASRPPSASSTGSFQLVQGIREDTNTNRDTTLGSKGESGGGIYR